MRQWMLVAVILVAAVSGRVCGAAEAPAAAEPEAGRIVARVDQVEITYADFKRRLESLQQERGPIPPQRYGDVLRGMVQEEILYRGALADGLEKDPEVKARLEEARRQVLVRDLLKRKVMEVVRVTDEDVRKMYDDSKAQFTSETVVARHILVKDKAEADAIVQELKEGKDFAELAKAKSVDSGSADKGGDLGPIRRGQTVAEFDEEAFRLKEGELSPVIKTEYGYHILKGGAHSTITQPFDEVKDRIRQQLLQEKQQQVFLAYMADLEKRVKSEVFVDRLR